jgi:hypothetical protein
MLEKQYQCKKCDYVGLRAQMGAHYLFQHNRENFKPHERKKKEKIKVIKKCSKCNKDFSITRVKNKYGIFHKKSKETSFCSVFCRHSRKQTLETKIKIRDGLQKIKPETKICAICSESFVTTKANKKTCTRSCANKLRYISKDERNKTSESLKGKTGGYRNFGGKGIKGLYLGYLYQSSWELAWIIYHLDNHLDFIRCSDYFLYEYQGKVLKYYPDFFINNTYIEIKGYMTERVQFKLASLINNKVKYEIIDKSGIKKYIDYALNNSSFFREVTDGRILL